MTIRVKTIALLSLALTGVTSVRAAEPPTIPVRTMKVLSVLYRGGPADKNRWTDAEVEYTKNGIELARLFYWRHSGCRLNLDIEYKVINIAPPNHDGPTYDNFIADLRKRGVKDNQYDGMFVTGPGMTGNWGGFRIFGRTGACFGQSSQAEPLTWYPALDPNTWYNTAWTFVHEFEHAWDGVIAQGSGHPEVLSDHPYADSGEAWFQYGHHAGMHWDWVAHCLSSFTNYMDVAGVTDTVIQVVDADADGLPDNDPRLPMDEKRFGSDPTKKDTDGDGLEDLAEFTADIYRGSNPTVKDTDGDGIPDGKDRWPTVAIALTLAYTLEPPTVDGRMDSVYALLTTGKPYIATNTAVAEPRLYACWNEEALSLFVKTQTKGELHLMIDSSGENGFWEGGDTYPIRVSADGKVTFTDLGLSGPVPGARAEWGTDGLEILIPAKIGQGVSNEINFGGKRRLEDTADGMTLLEGRDVSFNIIWQVGKDRALFTPLWSMFDVTPVKPADAPSVPNVKPLVPISRSRNPEVMVQGVRSNEMVLILDDNARTLGARYGSGRVILSSPPRGNRTGLPTTMNVYGQVAGSDRRVGPVAVVVDTMAAPPEITPSPDSGSWNITGEPGAQVDIFVSREGLPISPLTSVPLDKTGAAAFALPTSGFIGSYGLKKDFDNPVFRRIDPQIKFAYDGGAPDPRSPAENFCVRWSGYLTVPKTGDYTFYVTSDDGSRVFVNGKMVVDHWGHHELSEKSGTVSLSAGEHEIHVDYYEEDGWAGAHLEWSGPGIERTYALPVKPLASKMEPVQITGRQIDLAGNISSFAR